MKGGISVREQELRTASGEQAILRANRRQVDVYKPARFEQTGQVGSGGREGRERLNELAGRLARVREASYGGQVRGGGSYLRPTCSGQYKYAHEIQARILAEVYATLST